MIDRPLESLTRATLRMAELGFFGFVVKILEHTPLTNGLPSSAGTLFTGGRWGLRAPRNACCSVTNVGVLVLNERTGLADTLSPAKDRRSANMLQILIVVVVVGGVRRRRWEKCCTHLRNRQIKNRD